MAFEYLAYTLSRNSSNATTVDRSMLRSADDPFELPLADFQKLHRLSPSLTSELVERLETYLKGTRITAISPEKQVLSALRFYATGCYQRPVGEQLGISISQASISRSIHRVTDEINRRLFLTEVKFPMTQAERQAAKEIFSSAPESFVGGTIGAIDCTHILILAPRNHEEMYINHHGCHSINVQMICDPNLKILNVNAKFPGSQHDSYIWRSSAVRRIMQRSYEKGNHMFLIGDSEYPLEPWLMTPLPNEAEGSPKYRYNEALCKARNPVERLFDALKTDWRCLSEHRVLMYDPGFCGKIINACAVLHNFRLRDEQPKKRGTFTQDTRDFYTGNSTLCESDDNSLFSVAERIQDDLINKYFS